MKQLSFFLLLIAGMAYSVPSQAQFFRKLKKAVKKTVNSVATEVHDVDAPDTANTAYLNPLPDTMVLRKYYGGVRGYTIQPGEKIDFTESCLAIQTGISSAQIVIIKGNTRYLIGKNGKRIPLATTTIKGCPANFESSSDHEVSFTSIAYSASDVDREASDNFENLFVYSSTGVTGNFKMTNNLTPEQMQKMQAMADEMSEQQDKGEPVDTASMMKMGQMASQIHSSNNLKYDKNAAGTFINFNHKKYGPYARILSMLVNKDHTQFVAIVRPGESDMPLSAKPYSLLINSEGLKKKYDFKNASLLPYKNFNHYLISITSENSYALLDPATGRRIPIINNDDDKIMIDKSTGTFIQNVGNKIYLDGSLARVIPKKATVSARNIFVSPDHKRCAVWTSDGLYLPDGNTIGGVVSCSAKIQQGKKILNWIVLANDNKTLYLCHETL